MNILLDKNAEEYITVCVYYYEYKDDTKESLLMYLDKGDAPESIREKLKSLTGKFLIPDHFVHYDIMKEAMTAAGDNLNYKYYMVY